VHFAIVGAGPAGAALGYLLARAGARVTLLERQTDFAREFRGEVLMPSGLDAIAQMGLGAALDALPQSKIARGALYRGAEALLELPFGDGGPRVVSQPALLEMLASEAGKWPGFSLERGFTVRDLLLRDGAVVGVRGDSPGGPREIEADWVIGADGRASAVRKHSELDRERETQAFDVVWCRLPLPPDLAQQVRLYLSAGHFAIALPAPDGRLQLGWVIEKGAFGELRRRGVSEWLDELARTVSPDLGRHIQAHRDAVTSPFLLDVVCDHLDRWSAPGLLLLGDAAHPMSPVGAQGINIALRDAIVAANHLAPLAAGPADPRALLSACEAITRERLPEVRVIQRLQRLPPRLLFRRSALSRLLVGWVIPALARTRVLPLVFFRLVARRILFGTTEVRLADGGQTRKLPTLPNPAQINGR
jgi:2-polyprenyl-6-methoxyphenol hydroxylase-like FAD-dependent oxidoreductase